MDGLYMHIPFCFHKCHYCDFFSVVDNPPEDSGVKVSGFRGDRQAAFVDGLERELRWAVGLAQQRRQAAGQAEGFFADRSTSEQTFGVETSGGGVVFVGGGTPTLLREPLWRRLLATMRGLGLLDRVQEFTVEANPETVTPELLATLRQAGVNRLSMGAQSFDARHLKTLERWHDPARVGESVATARAAGFDNLNLDLIFAVPGQTMQDLQRDIETLLSLEVEHLSCYSLIFEPKTPMHRKLQMGRISAVGEELEAAMYEYVIDALTAAGYEHYEVSNFSRPGRQCRHNLMYWQSGNWLGVGPSASSHVAGVRWKNRADLRAYIGKAPEHPIEDVEQLPQARRLGEQLMMHIRLIAGVPRLGAESPRCAARSAPRSPILTQPEG